MFDPETNETGPLCVRVGNPNTLCRFQCLGETIGVQFSDQRVLNCHLTNSINPLVLNKALNSRNGPVFLLSLV